MSVLHLDDIVIREVDDTNCTRVKRKGQMGRSRIESKLTDFVLPEFWEYKNGDAPRLKHPRKLDVPRLQLSQEHGIGPGLPRLSPVGILISVIFRHEVHATTYGIS